MLILFFLLHLGPMREQQVITKNQNSGGVTGEEERCPFPLATVLVLVEKIGKHTGAVAPPSLWIIARKI
jgi:hypothetical protein